MEDSEQSKLFVGGISWDTTDDVLKAHFAKYGDVLGSVIARDRNSGHPRGFAFVTFSDSSAVDRALQDSHQILGRTVCLFCFLGFSFFVFCFLDFSRPFCRLFFSLN